MKDIMQVLEKLFSSQNPVWVTVVTGLFILILAFILSPSIGVKIIEIVSGKRKKGNSARLTRKHFVNHPIYDYLSYNMERLRSLDFGGKGKTSAVKDLLYLKLTVYRSKIKELIKEGIYITDKFEFKTLVHNTILKAEQDFEKEWKNLKIELLDELIKDYNTWHSQSTAFARMAICNITNSDIYDNIPERIQEILCILETKFRVTMPDIEKGLTEANGKYKDLQYKSTFF